MRGDANRDGEFDQLDIVLVQQAAKYLTGEPATWSEGDWNNDGVFNQLDIVAAQQAAVYLTGPYAAVPSHVIADVPEPNGLLLIALGVLVVAVCRTHVQVGSRSHGGG